MSNLIHPSFTIHLYSEVMTLAIWTLVYGIYFAIPILMVSLVVWLVVIERWRMK